MIEPPFLGQASLSAITCAGFEVPGADATGHRPFAHVGMPVGLTQSPIGTVLDQPGRSRSSQTLAPRSAVPISRQDTIAPTALATSPAPEHGPEVTRTLPLCAPGGSRGPQSNPGPTTIRDRRFHLRRTDLLPGTNEIEVRSGGRTGLC